ncbi:hypothetical protein DAI22_01g170200 [Oryza sativa Japonica Group]|nr:hypothetical protein DAI22_01g170200 [Oryza sativa Japonica Group]
MRNIKICIKKYDNLLRDRENTKNEILRVSTYIIHSYIFTPRNNTNECEYVNLTKLLSSLPSLPSCHFLLSIDRVSCNCKIYTPLRKSASDLLKESNLSQSAIMVDVWLEVESQTFDTAMSAITFQCLTIPTFMGGIADDKIVEENLGKLKKALEVYEARSCRFRYLAGDFISLADLSHFPMTHYLLATPHASVLDAYPHVKSWINDLMKRPAVKRVRELMEA